MKASQSYTIEVDAITICESDLSHAIFLSTRLRKNDLREIWIADSNPLYALSAPIIEKWFFKSVTYTGFAEGEPICMFGTVQENESDDKAIVWALGSDMVYKYKKSFVKASKKIIPILQNNYESLWNVVPYDHLETKIWLQMLGFQMDYKTFTVKNIPMVQFMRCKNYKNMSTVH